MKKKSKPAAKKRAAKRPGMSRGKKSFVEKLRPDMRSDVVDDPKGRGKMLLPTPMMVAAEISLVPPGALTTMPELRERMAKKNKADLACPLMSGIFFNIIAGAAEEQLAAGEKPVAPYWRVVLPGGALSPKTPDGPRKQAAHLRSEGHKIFTKRGKLFVALDA